MELARVLVSIVECGYSFTLEETELEVTFKDSIWVVEDTETMHLPSSELSLIEEFRARSPFEFPFPVILTVLEHPFESVSVSPGYLTHAMKDVCHKLTLIC